MNRNIPSIVIETPEEAVSFAANWIRENETQVECLAAQTGTFQERTIALANDSEGKTLLRVHITCEPRQFAKHSVEGEWAKLIGPK